MKRAARLAAHTLSCVVSLSLILSPMAGASNGSRATFDLPSTATTELERLLARIPGQSQFVTAEAYRGRGFGLESAPMAGARLAAVAQNDGGGAQRSVEDSDVYNTGPEGSRWLLLLNPERGLMFISFENGPNRPELLGRVPATGNDSRDMFVNWEHQRAVVIENWHRSDQDEGGRLLVYDVSNPADMKVVESVSIGGYVMDQRKVGDIIYVVGYRNEQVYDNSGANRWVRQSFIKSYSVSKNGLKLESEKDLGGAVDYRPNMGIQEVEVSPGQFRYYVTAITKAQDLGWWRWGTRSEVELYDITDANGGIRHVLTANVVGDIAKRSWVQFHDDALVVTSNYREGDAWNGPLKVAVETFRLPREGDTVIPEAEHQWRKMTIARALRLGEGAPTSDGGGGLEASLPVRPETPEELEGRLVNAGETQLRNVFVANDKGQLRKVMADFEPLMMQDTTGLSSAIQDVRLVQTPNGKRVLQIFWVPVTQIDPLDLVDVTNVNERPVYQSRLQFEGWIERAFPVIHNGRWFIVALGYIIPAVDNRQNRRIGQVRIFEIKRARGGAFKAEEVDNLDLPNFSWSDLGQHDKYVTFQFDDSSGRGSLLFRGDSYQRRRYVSGGQVVDFDLSQTDNPEAKLLSEGGFIQAEEGYLERVFSHRAVEAMMTFTRKELGVFGRAAKANNFMRIMTRMELSRNVVDFQLLPELGLGLQLISRGDYYDGSAVELRLVPGDRPDAEASGVLNRYNVDGRLVDFWLDRKSGDLFLLTATTAEERSNDVYTTRTEHVFRHVKLSQEKGVEEVGSPAVFESTRRIDYGRIGTRRSRQNTLASNLRGLVELDEARWAFVDDNANLWVLTRKGNVLSSQKVTLKLPDEFKDLAQLTLSRVSGQLVVTGQRPFLVGEPSELPVSLYEVFFGFVNVSTANAWTVESMVNIPGAPKGLVSVRGSVQGVLTEEQRVVDLRSPTLPTDPALNFAAFESGEGGGLRATVLKATVAFDPNLQLVQVSGHQWTAVEMIEDGRTSYRRRRPIGIWGGDGSEANRTAALVTWTVDASSGSLMRTLRSVPEGLSSSWNGASVLGVFDDAENPGHRLMALGSGSQVQVVRVNTQTLAVETLALQPLNLFVEPGAPAQTAVLNLPGWGHYNRRGSPVQILGDRLTVAQNGYGVCEAKLGGPVKPPADE